MIWSATEHTQNRSDSPHFLGVEMHFSGSFLLHMLTFESLKTLELGHLI